MLDGDLNSSYGREADLMLNDRSWVRVLGWNASLKGVPVSTVGPFY